MEDEVALRNNRNKNEQFRHYFNESNYSKIKSQIIMSLDDYPNISELKWKQPTEIMGAQRITKN